MAQLSILATYTLLLCCQQTECKCAADTASSDPHRKKPGIWSKIKRRLSTESPGQQGPGDSPANSPPVNTSQNLPGSGKHQTRTSLPSCRQTIRQGIDL